jgi:OmpA-OmpF porin, OOP family
MRKYFIMAGLATLMTASISASANATAFQGFFDEESGLSETATGLQFHQTLYSGYKNLSEELDNEYGDSKDGEHFNHKALLSGREAPAYPEEVDDRVVSSVAEFRGALLELKTVYDKGGRELAAVETATAQVSFDCWIEADEAGGRNGRADACKDAFWDALNAAKAKANKEIAQIIQSPPLADPDLSAPAPAPEPEFIPQAVLDKYFRVFFDFDSTDLTTTSQTTIQEAIEYLKQYKTLRINLVAHADRSGSVEYNDKLSERRADAVLNVFANAGIDLGRIDVVKAVGERASLVPTEDGVKLQENRAVELDLKR